ncbi:MAG TPA: ribonuclease Z [Blastocatellia bacterium]
MKAITLGTGSGRPTLKRNVSAVAVAWEDEWLLFDCGEATQIQMMKADLSMSRLSAIFITHLHGDHFNGLPGLLSTIGLNGRERELTVVGPPGISSYLELLRKLRVVYANYPVTVREFPEHAFFANEALGGQSTGRADASGDVRFGGPSPRRLRDPRRLRGGDSGFEVEVSSEENVQDPPAQTLEPHRGFVPVCVFETDRYAVSACPLDHRLYDLGYRIDVRAKPGRFDVERARALGIPEGPLFGRLQSGNDITLADGRLIQPAQVLGLPRPGRKMSYCTDTRPCAGSVLLSRGVDLMIHEATFADDLQAEAFEYGHSTSVQAARVAAEAGPDRLLITHISSRYPDPSVLIKEARAWFKNTELAHDLMEIPV